MKKMLFAIVLSLAFALALTDSSAFAGDFATPAFDSSRHCLDQKINPF